MSNAAASKENSELVKNLIGSVQDALETSGYVYTEEHGYPFPFTRPAQDGSSDEFILNFDEGTVTREKYNKLGTLQFSETVQIRRGSDLNQVLRHI